MRFRWLSMMSIAFIVTSCASSTEIPTVAEDPWATPEDQVDAGRDSGPDEPQEPKPPCGNGGSCNPKDLGGETCLGLGMGTGTLACDPVTCTYDTSMCEGANSMGMGGSGSSDNGSGNSGSTAGAGGSQTPFSGAGSGGSGGGGGSGNNDESTDGGTSFFGGNFFGGGNNNPD